MTSSPPLQSRAWLVVGVLWIAACLNYLDRIMITTMRSSLVDSIPMTEAQFGLLTSSFLWVYAGFSPIVGFLADRYSRSRLVVLSLFIWSAVTWLTAHATTFNELLIARALMGISEAAYMPAALALIVEYHPGRTRSRATSIHLTGFIVGTGLGGFGGWIAQHYHWNSPFILFGVIGIIHSVILLLVLRDPEPTEVSVSSRPQPRPDFVQALVALLTSGSFLLVLTVWGVIGIAGWGLIGWLPTYLSERFHLDQGTAGLTSTGYIAGAMLVGALVGGAWADRWSRGSSRGRILVPVIGLAIAAPATWIAAATHTLPVAIACILLYGFTRPFLDGNLMPVVCLIVDPRYRATAMGVLNLVSCTVGGLTIYAGGVLRDAHIDVSRVFQCAGIGLLLCSFLMFLLKPAPRAEEPC